MNAGALVGALLMLLPGMSSVRAERHARLILAVAADENDAAALAVTGAHESGFLKGHEVCRLHGIGGDGLYGLGVGYQKSACRSAEVQTQTAMRALREKGFPSRPIKAFRGYLGAHSDKWPEARERLSLWTLTAERIKCACCI